MQVGATSAGQPVAVAHRVATRAALCRISAVSDYTKTCTIFISVLSSQQACTGQGKGAKGLEQAAKGARLGPTRLVQVKQHGRTCTGYYETYLIFRPFVERL